MSLSFRKIVLFLILINTIPFYLSAFELTWEIDFGSVFDNREGDAGPVPSETFFFTTLSPEIGVRFSPTDRIAGGAVWNQPLQNGIKDGKIIPTLYYRHENDKWKFSMGMFPLTQLREPLPGFLWCDSLTYFQQNIRGALVEYNSNKGFFYSYIDWRGMQSKTTREAFNIVFHGEYDRELFLAGGHAMMNHLARKKDAPDTEFVVDNFLVNPYIGINLKSKTSLDSLVIKAGALLTIERDRRVRKWNTPVGLWVEGVAEWRFLGLKNTLYAGKPLFPLYGDFGSLLYQGEPYYQSSFYDRLDIYAKIYRNKYIELEAQLNFNFTSEEFKFYQRLILNIELGNITNSSKPRRRIY